MRDRRGSGGHDLLDGKRKFLDAWIRRRFCQVIARRFLDEVIVSYRRHGLLEDCRDAAAAAGCVFYLLQNSDT